MRNAIYEATFLTFASVITVFNWRIVMSKEKKSNKESKKPKKESDETKKQKKDPKRPDQIITNL
jgi:flagellar biosynthesis component FlhA